LLTRTNEAHAKEIILTTPSVSPGLYSISITLVSGEQITRSIYLK
jgi:hypothetical protein